jgi:hypothetical protein
MHKEFEWILVYKARIFYKNLDKLSEYGLDGEDQYLMD